MIMISWYISSAVDFRIDDVYGWMNNISKIYIKTLYIGRQCRMIYRELGINYMKRITLDEIELKYKLNKYEDLYKKVMELYDAGMLKLVKASGKNGKKPALYMD